MPCSRFCVVSHWDCNPCAHIQQVLQEMLNGMTTRSPAFTAVTSEPTSRTIPMGSWPITSPTDMKGAITSIRWRSDPQMPLEVISTITSVGSWMVGSGTVSTRTSARPCQVTARMRELLRSDGIRAPEKPLWYLGDLDRVIFNHARRVSHSPSRERDFREWHAWTFVLLDTEPQVRTPVLKSRIC